MTWIYAKEKCDSHRPTIVRFENETDRENWIGENPDRLKIVGPKMIRLLDRVGFTDTEMYFDDADNHLYLF